MTTVQDKKNGYILSVCVKISDRNSPWYLFHNTELQQSSNAWVIVELNSSLSFFPGHPFLPFLRPIRIFLLYLVMKSTTLLNTSVSDKENGFSL